MKSYNLPLTSLFLVLMSACTLNADVDADVDDINLNTPDLPNGGGTGGSSVVPPVGGAGGNAGTSAGGSPSASVDGGVEAGAGGDIGIGGSENYPDAGVAGSAGEAGTGNVANDAGTDPDPVVRECDTPEAVGSDKGNWFTTNTKTPLRPNWFQLIDADGFTDSCTYVGHVKWYHPEPDQNGIVWYVSEGYLYNPTSIFTIHFNDDGSVADAIKPTSRGDTVYPGMDFSVEVGPDPDGLTPGQRANLIFTYEYMLHYRMVDLSPTVNMASRPIAGMFRGVWSNVQSAPILLEPLPEPPPPPGF